MVSLLLEADVVTQPSYDPPTIELDPDQVAAYLRQHPDFFIEYEQLLSELALPHHTGDHAISLVERQVSVLRTRNREVRNRLNRLLETARDNDRLFQKTRKLVLALLEQEQAGDLASTILASLRDDFQVDACAMILVSSTEKLFDGVRTESLAAIHQSIGALLHSQQPVCGHLRPSETAFLFADTGREVQSAAVVQLLLNEQLLGVLAIGSFDPEQYRSGSGTMFLGYLADVLNRLLPRCMQA